MNKENINIIFSGDLSCTGSYAEKILNKEEVFDSSLLNKLSKSDFHVCNFEGAATNRKVTIRPDVNVKSPVESVKYLTNRNINIFNLANNHIFDAGIEGYQDTIQNIANCNAFFLGAGNNTSEASQPFIIRENNISIGLIALCDYSRSNAKNETPGINPWKGVRHIKSVIKKHLSDCDWVILSFHGGEEHTEYPSPPKRRILRRILKRTRTDIIIGHHSHSFQKIEFINNKPIFYSLGNFIFNIDAHQNYKSAIESNLIQFNFSKKDYDYSLIPISLDTQNGFIQFNDQRSSSADYYNLNNYRQNWQRDAYKLLFERPVIQHLNDTGNSDIALQSQNILQILLRKKFYKKLLYILKDKYSRSVYLNAIIYKFIRN